MNKTREFETACSPLEAASRAQTILAALRFRIKGVGNELKGERSFPFSGALVVRPQQVHCLLDIQIMPLPSGGCRISVRQRVFKMGSPASMLDKVVWNGELDDLENMIVRHQPPKVDRIKQDLYSGRITWIFIGFAGFVATIFGFPAASVWGVVGGLLTGLLIFVVLALMLPYFPFPVREFPLENPMPEADFDSNYIRLR